MTAMPSSQATSKHGPATAQEAQEGRCQGSAAEMNAVGVGQGSVAVKRESERKAESQRMWHKNRMEFGGFCSLQLDALTWTRAQAL
jgi:hypothetical protein